MLRIVFLAMVVSVVFAQTPPSETTIPEDTDSTPMDETETINPSVGDSTSITAPFGMMVAMANSTIVNSTASNSSTTTIPVPVPTTEAPGNASTTSSPSSAGISAPFSAAVLFILPVLVVS